MPTPHAPLYLLRAEGGQQVGEPASHAQEGRGDVQHVHDHVVRVVHHRVRAVRVDRRVRIHAPTLNASNNRNVFVFRAPARSP